MPCRARETESSVSTVMRTLVIVTLLRAAAFGNASIEARRLLHAFNSVSLGLLMWSIEIEELFALRVSGRDPNVVATAPGVDSGNGALADLEWFAPEPH